VIVGVNRHTETEEEGAPLLFRPDHRVIAEQAARLAAHRSHRDTASVDTALGEVRSAAMSDDSLMPPILDAVRAEATLGEICGALRAVFGEYHPPATI
jgi:methylmalonyl-CoA mutase N-terminal domain/subunit